MNTPGILWNKGKVKANSHPVKVVTRTPSSVLSDDITVLGRPGL